MTSIEVSARDRILDAALIEFSTRGYESASTNAIAAAAGVAKGLVFHHFGSKEQLFAELFDVELQRFVDGVFTDLDTSSADLFERLHQLSMRKIKLAQQRPRAAEFLVIALSEAPAGVRATLAVRQAELMRTAWPRLLDGLDPRRLRAGITLADAAETIGLLAEGLEKQVLALLKARELTMPEVNARVWRHFERLRDGLYR
ncbi:MAG: TetR/AcrR family transcriptional regulator [Myxococcaceae bacterium]|nr:TetR/AcrR family transcriptional regulator [Myxococcaceae bacterium]